MCLPIAAANFLATIIVFRCATELSAYYLIKRIGWSITKHFLASTIGSAPDWCLWLFILQVCVHTISYCWISLCKTRNHVACLIVEHCNVLVESILILSIYPVVFIGMLQYLWWAALQLAFQSFKGLFGYVSLKFNSHHINVSSNAWSTKCRLIACMLTQIRSNLRDESIKPN
jgi:hypothetical protein